jgi:hypothetical protein
MVVGFQHSGGTGQSKFVNNKCGGGGVAAGHVAQYSRSPVNFSFIKHQTFPVNFPIPLRIYGWFYISTESSRPRGTLDSPPCSCCRSKLDRPTSASASCSLFKHFLIFGRAPVLFQYHTKRNTNQCFIMIIIIIIIIIIITIPHADTQPQVRRIVYKGGSG